jgi:rhodanese-related sulfurtransferase
MTALASLVTVFVITILLACSTANTASNSAISARNLHSMLQEHENFDLVDVRTPLEYDAGHISGAELIPLNNILNDDFKLNKDDTIVLYCRSGRRSGIALKYLEEHGYKHVEHLEGGILTWKYGLTKGPEANAVKGDINKEELK